jgi:hypothetical protein
VWKPPNFLVDCPGVYSAQVDVVCLVDKHWVLKYKILPYMVDGKVYGWVVLDPKYWKGRLEDGGIDLEDLDQLERVSADLNDLRRDVEDKHTCISTDMPMEHVKGQFEKAGVSFLVHRTGYRGRLDIYGTYDLYELMKASQTLGIGFY